MGRCTHLGGGRKEEGEVFLVNGRSGKGIARFFVFITELSYPTVFFLFLALLKYPHFQSLPCLLNPCSQCSLSNCFGAVYTSGRRAEEGRGFLVNGRLGKGIARLPLHL